MHRTRSARPSGRIATAALAAALVVLSIPFAPPADADVVAGRGELHAAGNGLAVLVFRGRATVRGIGLAVAERDDILETRGEGHVTPLGDGRVLLEGFGRITVRSLRDRTRLEAAGAHLRLHARGVGVAHLKGTGLFHTEDRDGAWEPDAAIAFDSDE
jgi:hypothetical protein